MNRQKLLGEEKISKLLIQFSVPAIIGMMVNTLYNIVDRMYIGNIPEVGGLALTGVGITMPIMTPVADIVGVSRQTAVLAYHFGDGFSNMFWPTACALECGLMGVPINKWYKFMTPLFCIMMVLQVVFILISVVVYA